MVTFCKRKNIPLQEAENAGYGNRFIIKLTPLMLPYLTESPLALFPRGINHEYFYFSIVYLIR